MANGGNEKRKPATVGGEPSLALQLCLRHERLHRKAAWWDSCQLWRVELFDRQGDAIGVPIKMLWFAMAEILVQKSPWVVGAARS